MERKSDLPPGYDDNFYDTDWIWIITRMDCRCSKYMIPKKLRDEMDAMPYYHRCCLTGFTRFKIDWHHVLIFAGRQVNEKEFIMPVWEKMHSPQGKPDSVHNCKETKEHVEYLSYKRASEKQIKKYNLEQRFKYLTKKYGKGSKKFAL